VARGRAPPRLREATKVRTELSLSLSYIHLAKKPLLGVLRFVDVITKRPGLVGFGLRVNVRSVPWNCGTVILRAACRRLNPWEQSSLGVSALRALQRARIYRSTKLRIYSGQAGSRLIWQERTVSGRRKQKGREIPIHGDPS
jgi:hypothetical protein